MDLSNLIEPQKKDTPLIQKDTDPLKYEEIKTKLCAKRKLLEDTLNRNDITSIVREDTALELLQLKEAMSVFGVSEVDYIAYLTKLNETPTLPFL